MDLWQILFERSQGPRFPGLVHDRGTVLRKYKLSHLQLSVGDHPSWHPGVDSAIQTSVKYVFTPENLMNEYSFTFYTTND